MKAMLKKHEVSLYYICELWVYLLLSSATDYICFELPSSVIKKTCHKIWSHLKVCL